MPIVYNGTQVHKVIYNGTELSEIVYNGTQVFHAVTTIACSITPTTRAGGLYFRIYASEPCDVYDKNNALIEQGVTGNYVYYIGQVGGGYSSFQMTVKGGTFTHLNNSLDNSYFVILSTGSKESTPSQSIVGDLGDNCLAGI